MPTITCNKCFKNYRNNDIFSLVLQDYRYCFDCFSHLKPKFKTFRFQGIRGLYIYDYDETIKENLYQLKGCYDVELYDYFLAQYKLFLHLKYLGYTIVPMPSSYEDDEARGFNHVVKIFSVLNLPIETILYKTQKYKQSDQTHDKRREIFKIMKLSHLEKIKNKKILLVDDVFTTGNTLSAAINLVREANPRRIQILVMSKTSFHT